MVSKKYLNKGTIVTYDLIIEKNIKKLIHSKKDFTLAMIDLKF